MWSFLGSIIVAGLTLIGVVYSSKRAEDRSEAIQDAKIDRIVEINKITFDHIEEEIVSLTKAQEKHNSTIERTYGLEKQQAETLRDIKTLYNNLDDVKGDVRGLRGTVDSLTKDVAEIKEGEVRLEEKLNK